jgi:LysR family transcriptional regulator, nod-box dependent transcriptional activator
VSGGNRRGIDASGTDSTDTSGALRRADLNLIPALAVLLRERHVTRAAEFLGIGQPAMSSALGRLRKLFKDPLLVRNGHVLELTPLGQVLVDPVQDVLTQLDHLLRIKPTFDPMSDSRSFTIAASDYVTLVLLRPLLERLHQEAPEVVVNVVPINLSTSIAIERAQVDLAIIPDQYMTSKASYVQHLRLFSDKYVPVVAKQNHEVVGTLEREAMQCLPYVCYYDQSCGPALVDQALAELGIEPRTALATASITMVPVLIPGTPNFGFVPQRLLRHCHVRDDLRTLRTSVRIAPIVQHMYWHPVLQRDPAHQWLRDRTIALAASL